MSSLPPVLLASDTETRPTPEMRRAIAAAEVGDEQKGEDPTVRALEERVADLLGQEDALWLPTGTMCNLVAIKVWTRPGDAVVADWMSHVIRAESAGSALASGVLFEAVRTERGIVDGDALQRGLDRVATLPSPWSPPARLVCVEQTHNFGGGTVWTLGELDAMAAVARDHDLRIHMDGARLLNAAVAHRVQPASYGRRADSVWIDFTKGLGAPIGAVMAGSRSFVAEARRFKQAFGGAMRQAGIAAAGCLWALDHHVDRLAEDHENAAVLAAGLAEVDGLRVRTPRPETNIVFFDVTGLGLECRDFLARLADAGIRMAESRGEIRAVTHLDVSREDVERAVAAVAGIVRDLGGDGRGSPPVGSAVDS